ncbi:hypothetical protein GCM10009557_33140 [Virgisporangium ochraceum]
MRSPAGPPSAKRPKDRKDRIALAGAELFCQRGYHGVSVDEIAAAVGISGPAVYRHFPTKYAILVHVTRDLAAISTPCCRPSRGSPSVGGASRACTSGRGGI